MGRITHAKKKKKKKKKHTYQLELDLETEGGSFDRGGAPKDVGARLQGLSPGEGGVAGAGLQGGGTQGRCRGSYATPLEQCCNAGPTKRDNTKFQFHFTF